MKEKAVGDLTKAVIGTVVRDGPVRATPVFEHLRETFPKTTLASVRQILNNLANRGVIDRGEKPGTFVGPGQGRW